MPRTWTLNPKVDLPTSPIAKSDVRISGHNVEVYSDFDNAFTLNNLAPTEQMWSSRGWHSHKVFRNSQTSWQQHPWSSTSICMRVEACDCEIMKVYSAILCHTETSGNQISNSFIGLMMRIGGQIIMDFLSHYHGLGSWVNEIIGHQTFIKILSKQSRISWLQKQQKRFHKNLVKVHIFQPSFTYSGHTWSSVHKLIIFFSMGGQIFTRNPVTWYT